MRLPELLMLLSFCAPLFISLIAMGMMIARRGISTNNTKRKLLALAIGYFFCIFFSGICIILFIFEWKYYIYTSPLSFLVLLLSTVFFYNIIYLLTSDDPLKNPALLHYVIPLIITLFYVIWSLFVPSHTHYEIMVNKNTEFINYKWYSIVYNSKLVIYVLYELIYTVLILRRMPVYRKYVTNYTADEEKYSLNWLYLIIILTMVIIPLSIVTFLSENREYITFELIAITGNLLYAAQIIILQYHIFTENYIIMSEDSRKFIRDSNTNKTINKREFEKYIKTNKPYLNPKLKITDLIYEFRTCRSYLSNFINRTYGMNFSYYINSLRMEEFKRLRKESQNANCTDTELIIRSGFSNYRSFLRFKKNEENKIKKNMAN